MLEVADCFFTDTNFFKCIKKKQLEVLQTTKKLSFVVFQTDAIFKLRFLFSEVGHLNWRFTSYYIVFSGKGQTCPIRDFA